MCLKFDVSNMRQAFMKSFVDLRYILSNFNCFYFGLNKLQVEDYIISML